MTKSPYVCAVCGVSAIRWLDGWKHANGWRGPESCGKPPRPVERGRYEEDLNAMVDMVRSRTAWVRTSPT
jgi:hypothetical protein